jgi:hypothetical protein
MLHYRPLLSCPWSMHCCTLALHSRVGDCAAEQLLWILYFAACGCAKLIANRRRRGPRRRGPRGWRVPSGKALEGDWIVCLQVRLVFDCISKSLYSYLLESALKKKVKQRQEARMRQEATTTTMPSCRASRVRSTLLSHL